jgi:hypothetical protein
MIIIQQIALLLVIKVAIHTDHGFILMYHYIVNYITVANITRIDIICKPIVLDEFTASSLELEAQLTNLFTCTPF